MQKCQSTKITNKYSATSNMLWVRGHSKFWKKGIGILLLEKNDCKNGPIY